MPHRHSPDGGASSTQYLPDGVQGQMIELRKALRVRPGLMAFPDFRIPLLIICPGPGGLPPGLFRLCAGNVQGLAGDIPLQLPEEPVGQDVLGVFMLSSIPSGDLLTGLQLPGREGDLLL